MTGFVFLNKDEGMTSFFAASRLRRIFSTKKVGHTGPLDPMATGVLPVAVGGATRFIDFMPDSDKSYRARFLLGKTTDTLDITGQVLTESEVNVKREDVEKIISDFTGEIFQVPPMYSALKKDGVRLCVCDGSCDRRERPLSCMIFPFFPYTTPEGRIKVIPDIRGGAICPIVRNFAETKLDRRFLRRVKKVGRLLAQDKECRAFLEGISREMDVYIELSSK